MRSRLKNDTADVTIARKYTALASPRAATGVNSEGATVEYGPTLFNGWDPEYYSTLSIYDDSSMTDELAYKTRIGFVDHTKRVTEIMPSTIDRVAVTTSRRRSVNGDFRSYVYAFERGEVPHQHLYQYLRGTEAGLGTALGVNLASLPSTDVSALVAKLAPRVVAGMSQMQLAISGWEAREVPSLFSMFMGKGRLGKLLRRDASLETNLFRRLRRLIAERLELERKRLEAIRKGRLERGGRYLDGVETRNIRNARDLAKDLALSAAELQLLWEFGISPTVSDIKSIAAELKKGFKGIPLKGKTFSASSSVTTTKTHSKATHGVLTDVECVRTDTLTTTVTCRITPVTPKGVSPKMSALNAKIDRYLGANQLGSIWAVAPWSFMIDWLASVDTYLDVLFLNNTDRFRVVWAVSRKREVTYEATGKVPVDIIVDPSNPGSTIQVFDRIFAKDKASRYIREPMAAPSASSMLLRSRASIKKTYLAGLIAIGIFSSRK